MKIKKYIVPFLLSTCLFSINSNASNLDLNATTWHSEFAKIHGTGYWQSSTIREWLNSDSKTVSYTSNRPPLSTQDPYGYGDEAGFLSEFTQEEKDAIAVTRRKVFVSDWHSPDGGNMNPPSHYKSIATSNSFGDLITNKDNYFYQILNDKVFFMSSIEYFYYRESREDFENYKRLRSDIKDKLNHDTSTVNWFINHQFMDIYSHTDTCYYIGHSVENMLDNTSPDKPQGIVPALHIKPNYLINGMEARNLQIKETVTFGTYNGSPIEWEVANITNDGYVYLLSKDILGIKYFSSKGNDVTYKHSKYINYANHDVDISTDLQVSPMMGGDVELPSLTIANEDELHKRQIGSFTIKFSLNDNAGIKYMILPDRHSKVYNQNSVDYTIAKNGDYFVEVVDINGNRRQYKIPVHNINEPSKVLVEPSTTDWTKDNVSVSIKASTQMGSYADEVITNKRDYYFDEWANYNSYKGRDVRITGSVEIASHGENPRNVNVQVAIYHNIVYTTPSGDMLLKKSLPRQKNFTVHELINSGKQDFDIVFRLPDNLHNYVQPVLLLDVYDYERDTVVKWTNVKYELVNTADDFGIDRIELPDGTEVQNNSYTHVLTEKGEYVYKVYDNNGRVTESRVNAKIDKKNPTINVTKRLNT